MIAGLSNPQRFMRASAALLPWMAAAAAATLGAALIWALLFSPEDAVQRQAVRILYVHVPAAWWSMGIFAFMGVASFIGIVWRHALADLAAKAAAPVGAAYAGLALITGSLWGAPTWGTWWVWDARLTSMLILFLTYLGYLSLWAAVEDEAKAARLAAILCLAGLINLPIVHFSVTWWNTLHQPASILRTGGSAMHPAMLHPLLLSALGYALAFAALLMAGMRAEIFRRRALAARAHA
ncbi:MAG: heme ABC transporter permease CcmC [Hyphomonadaceae bacterium]